MRWLAIPAATESRPLLGFRRQEPRANNSLGRQAPTLGPNSPVGAGPPCLPNASEQKISDVGCIALAKISFFARGACFPKTTIIYLCIDPIGPTADLMALLASRHQCRNMKRSTASGLVETSIGVSATVQIDDSANKFFDLCHFPRGRACVSVAGCDRRRASPAK
jgi:hypothetical protein